MDKIEAINLKTELIEATKKLNQKIIEFENELKALELGVQVWVPISPNVHLGYTRYKGEWHITIKFKDEINDIWKCDKLIEVNRNLRLFGYQHRNVLIPAIKMAAEALLNRINEELK